MDDILPSQEDSHASCHIYVLFWKFICTNSIGEIDQVFRGRCIILAVLALLHGGKHN